jgi:acyl dehydratase
MTLKIGQKASVTRIFSRADAAELTGGAAPDSVPEPLIAGLFSYLLGVKLPGSGTNYLKQEMTFLAPAPYDQHLTASVEITRLRPDKHLADLETVCRLDDGAIVCSGRALVLVKDVGV